MKKIYSSVFSLALCFASAQEVQWQKDIPSNTQDFLTHLAITLDGQFLVAGSSIRNEEQQNKGYDYHIVKLNQQGNQVWEKYFGGLGHDFLTATTATQEGGFLLAGTSNSPTGGDKTAPNYGSSDVWVIKVSENGNLEWQKSLGGIGTEEAKAVTQTNDLHYVIASDIQNPGKGLGSKDVWLVKLDKAGKATHEIILGGKGLDEVEKIIPTDDGGILVAIYTRSQDASNIQTKAQDISVLNPQMNDIDSQSVLTNTAPNTNLTKKQNENKEDKTPLQLNPEFTQIKTELIAKQGENYGEGDYWIVKLDKDLKQQWQKSLGGKEDDHIRTIKSTSTGYIIGGESRSGSTGTKQTSVKEGTDLWVINLDKNGKEEWQKSFSFKNRDLLMSMDVIHDKSGENTTGFLIGGYSHHNGQVQKDEETFWILYLDGKGEEVWRKHVEGKQRKKEERLVSAKMTNEGNYIMAGTSAEELGKENWKIIKLGDKEIEKLIVKQEIRIYPNPVEDYTYVEIGFDFKEAQLKIYDMSGRQIQSLETKNKVTKLNTASLPQGVYIVTAETKTPNQKLNAKIIKR